MREERTTVAVGAASFDIACRTRSSSSDLAVFIHGLGCSKDSFRLAFERPELRDFSLLSFDLPGFGHSSKPEDFSYALEELALVSQAVLKKHRKPRFHVVAHSMGGAVGLLLAGGISNQLISFINIEGNLTRDDCGLLSRRASGLSFESFLQDPSFNRLHRSEKYNRHLALPQSLPLALYRSARSLCAWSDGGDLLRLFSGLRCRKAYVHGAESHAPAALAPLDGVEILAIPDSGHFPMNENPDAFYPLLGKLLRRYSRDSRLI